MQQYRATLDPSLESLPAASVITQPPMNKPDKKQSSSSEQQDLAAAVEEIDEDLKGDLQRVQFGLEENEMADSLSTTSASGAAPLLQQETGAILQCF